MRVCVQLSADDKKLPAVEGVLPLLKKGIGIHHGGLLPILKEVIEILFQVCECVCSCVCACVCACMCAYVRDVCVHACFRKAGINYLSMRYRRASLSV